MKYTYKYQFSFNFTFPQFLERLDVVDNASADSVLETFLDARPDIIESITFNGKRIQLSQLYFSDLKLFFLEQFWDNLSIESAFLARGFTKFLQKKQVNRSCT
jgi:hypothetical protein